MKPTDAEIDDAIEAWHASEGPAGQLHEWLGWTLDEYWNWVKSPDQIPDKPLKYSDTTAQGRAV